MVLVSFNNNTKGATSEAGTVYPSGATPVSSVVHVAESLVFCVVFCRSLFLCFLLLTIILHVLLFKASDYLSGTFKLFVEHLSYLGRDK